MTENQFEQAQMLEERVRLEGIERSRRLLARKGNPDCIDCDIPIAKKRRAAVPNAERCAECQTIYERNRKHGR
jgi:RNA polymerase-binding transcription factor DksA